MAELHDQDPTHVVVQLANGDDAPKYLIPLESVSKLLNEAGYTAKQMANELPPEKNAYEGGDSDYFSYLVRDLARTESQPDRVENKYAHLIIQPDDTIIVGDLKDQDLPQFSRDLSASDRARHERVFTSFRKIAQDTNTLTNPVGTLHEEWRFNRLSLTPEELLDFEVLRNDYIEMARRVREFSRNLHTVGKDRAKDVSRKGIER